MRCRLFFVVSGSLGACAHKTLMRQKKEGKRNAFSLIAFWALMAPAAASEERQAKRCQSSALMAPLRQQKRKKTPMAD